VRVLRVCTLLFVLPAVLCGRSSPVGADQRTGVGYRVIVNAANPAESVDRRFLTDAFLKKVTRWPTDLFIRPADQAPDSTARQAFCDDVLRRSVSAVKSYWQQMVFSGRGVPPPELDGDAEVLKFVLRSPGAVGYVSAGANVAGAKIIAVK
jgi:ABC-type phosphate transport system substrate-binding protein